MLEQPGGRHVYLVIAGDGQRRQHGDARSGMTITIDSSLPTTSGSLTDDETWSGTVTLTGDITVPDGVTLTIEPGTQVRAMALNDDQGGGTDTSRIELIVNGVLSAAGTEGSPIVFTSNSGNPASGDWTGIRLVPGSNGADLSMSHCTVRYCETGVDYQSSGYSADIGLDHCTFEYASQDGVYVYATSGAKLTLTVSDSTIQETGRYGVYTYAYNTTAEIDAQVTGNTIQDTASYGLYILRQFDFDFPERCAGDGKHGSKSRVLRHLWVRQQRGHVHRGVGQRSIGDHGQLYAAMQAST